MSQLKKAYNENLKRIWKAMDYLDNPSRTQEEIDKWLPDYNELLLNQERLKQQLNLQSGDKRVVEGFEIDE